jgi:hypothetical protein
MIDKKSDYDETSEKIDISVDDDDKKKSVSSDDYTQLADQIANEWTAAWKHQQPEKDEAYLRLKLFNNQRRDKEAVGDTTMFSVFWTVLASLYDDRLAAEFDGREEGDEETADNLDAVADFDYDEMMKDQVDFDWDFDTCFFGWGIVDMEQYYRDADNNEFYPMPSVIDPLTFLRDPEATSINGRDKRGTGAARFMGYEIGITKQEILDNEHIFPSIKTGDFSELSNTSTAQSLLYDAQEARNNAQNLGNTTKDQVKSLGDNHRYQVTVWYTHTMFAGKISKVKVWLANDRSKVLGIKLIEKKYWPLVKRSLYPHSHDWRGTSIPDMTEDKQRARAIAINLGIRYMKQDLDPKYAYDTSMGISRKDLEGTSNFVGIDGTDRKSIMGAITPLNKVNPNLQLVDFIMNSLAMSAEKATATPDIQQGIQSEKDRPLGETNIIAARTDTRYSLSAKIFGWSEREFWFQWYQLYKDFFAEDIDEKIVRIVGAFGAKWRPLDRKSIICKLDPDIKILSKNVSRALKIEERRSFAEFLTYVAQDPNTNKRYGFKKLGRLFGLAKDELDRLFPMTIDERMAEIENERLSENQYVATNAEDDHNVHLEILAKAKETPATQAHRIEHQQALLLKKTNPEMFPQDQSSAQFQQDGSPNPQYQQIKQPTQVKPSQMAAG